MADYSRYKTETLKKMLDTAKARYYAETEKPCGNWGDGMRRSRLPQNKAWERAKDRYEAISAELNRRTTEDKCINCVHNVGVEEMNCDHYCYGVEEIADEGWIVVRCDDYKKRADKEVRGNE